MTLPQKWIACVAATLLVAMPVVAQDKGRTEAEETLSAIVRIKTKIIKDARSAETLGLQRDGTGVLIRDGYILTIGYLVIEAEAIEVTGADGTAVTTPADSGCSSSSHRSPASRCRWAMRPRSRSARRR